MYACSAGIDALSSSLPSLSLLVVGLHFLHEVVEDLVPVLLKELRVVPFNRSNALTNEAKRPLRTLLESSLLTGENAAATFPSAFGGEQQAARRAIQNNLRTERNYIISQRE